MKHDRNSMSRAVFMPLQSAWEHTMTAGLRQATDVELLWMLDEIEVQLGERAAPWGSRTRSPEDTLPGEDDVPDWDDKSPEELLAITRELESDRERKPAGLAGPPHRTDWTCASEPRRARGDQRPIALRCEELEPRYPPSVSFALVA